MIETTLLSLFLIGLSFGATACMFTCMPFLSPLLLTNSSNLKESLGVMIPFSLGRVTSYISIALVSSWSAFLVKEIINNKSISQTILGVATIVVALFILKNTFSNKPSCCSSTQQNKKPQNKFAYFFMGAGISLNPCVPVMTLVTTSAYATNSFEAFSFGLIFGLGAISASFLVFGVILSKMAQEIMMELKKYKKHIEVFAASLLLLVGIMTLNGYISL